MTAICVALACLFAWLALSPAPAYDVQQAPVPAFQGPP